MISLLHRAVELLQRAKLLRWSSQLRIDKSTRLLRQFAVQFHVTPEQRSYLQIGERGIINSHFVFESAQGSVIIGRRSYLGAGTSLICRRAITLGDDVTVAWGVTIYDHNSHSLDWADRAKATRHFYELYGRGKCFETLDWTAVESAPIVIESRVWIGFGAVVLKGVTIGEGAIVGAGSVVASDVEPYTIVAGNPARLVRRLGTFAN